MNWEEINKSQELVDIICSYCCGKDGGLNCLMCGTDPKDMRTNFSQFKLKESTTDDKGRSTPELKSNLLKEEWSDVMDELGEDRHVEGEEVIIGPLKEYGIYGECMCWTVDGLREALEKRKNQIVKITIESPTPPVESEGKEITTPNNDDELRRLMEIIIPRAKDLGFKINKAQFCWIITEIEKWSEPDTQEQCSCGAYMFEDGPWWRCPDCKTVRRKAVKPDTPEQEDKK